MSKDYEMIRALAMQYVAHDSGDGQTIYHCGQGSTRFITRDGIKTLGETVGTVQMVLVNTGAGGVWREAIIHSFGEQPLMKVTLRRNKKTKELFFTPEHRWMVRDRNHTGNETRARQGFHLVTTNQLQAGDQLSWLLPKSEISRTTPSVTGIAHGLVFGDGTRPKKGSARIDLWGDKNINLIEFFGPSRTKPIKTPNGVLGIRVLDQPRFFKELPTLNEDVPYLYGWLAGYFAADGCVATGGDVVLHCANKSTLEFAQTVATRLGIGTYEIGQQLREGFGKMSYIYKLPFIGSTLHSNFFLVPEHRERFDAKFLGRKVVEHIGWTVDYVEETGLVEEVFCPRVSGEFDNFVLEGWINTANCPFCGSGQVVGRSDSTVECSFCGTHFTVQVQPEFQAMPQTIDGEPQTMPGMPHGSDPITGEVPGEGDEAGEVDPEGSGQDEEEAEGETDPNANPFPAKSSAAIKSAARSQARQDAAWLVANHQEPKYYITAEGGVLSEEAYIKHIALHMADDPNAVLADIRRVNASV